MTKGLHRLGTGASGVRFQTAFTPQPSCSRLTILCFNSSSGFLPGYFGLCSEPIFEVVTVFTAPFLVKLIRMHTSYILGQFERALLGLRG